MATRLLSFANEYYFFLFFFFFFFFLFFFSFFSSNDRNARVSIEEESAPETMNEPISEINVDSLRNALVVYTLVHKSNYRPINY